MIGTIVIISVVIAGVKLLTYQGKKKMLHRHYTQFCAPPAKHETDIIFAGNELTLAAADVHKMLMKRFQYYHDLEPRLQQKFIERLQTFMRQKTFIIKDDEGFKDMPVLTSAAAVQLTFGLKEYLLPFYQYIRIYPEEYCSEEALKILMGNVRNNVISIAWSHLLQGYAVSNDGSNVMLHEMGHALYMQKMVIDNNFAKPFAKKFNNVIEHCTEACAHEVAGRKNLYSTYAEADLQEFWAESVELFFEKPELLYQCHPQVYQAMQLLLQQNPQNKTNPLVKTKTSIREKLALVADLLTT
ncbi:MAG: zinc-dependent peptidase [Bacteroidota bacterium]